MTLAGIAGVDKELVLVGATWAPANGGDVGDQAAGGIAGKPVLVPGLALPISLIVAIIAETAMGGDGSAAR